jgi:hypothetical protein
MNIFLRDLGRPFSALLDLGEKLPGVHNSLPILITRLHCNPDVCSILGIILNIFYSKENIAKSGLQHDIVLKLPVTD